MNSKDFNELVEARCNKIKATLASKGKEYSTDDDKLHNFNKASIRSGQSREKALMGMKLKHEISIDDIILNLDKGRIPTIEIIDEKIGDIINYFVLLEACLVDRTDKENIKQQLKKYPIEVCDSRYTSKEQENSSKFLEGQRNQIQSQKWIREKSQKILKDQQDKVYINSNNQRKYQVQDVDLITGILSLRHGFTEVIKVSYFELSNEELWKEDS